MDLQFKLHPPLRFFPPQMSRIESTVIPCFTIAMQIFIRPMRTLAGLMLPAERRAAERARWLRSPGADVLIGRRLIHAVHASRRKLSRQALAFLPRRLPFSLESFDFKLPRMAAHAGDAVTPTVRRAPSGAKTRIFVPASTSVLTGAF